MVFGAGDHSYEVEEQAPAEIHLDQNAKRNDNIPK
jgi:hypothetical protein